MLRIDISSAGITGTTLGEYHLPTPPNGTETEINGDLILLFEDEQEAVAYLDVLEDYTTKLDNHSPQKPIVNDLVIAINNDEFVQAYLQ
jgi:hypothetical protein